MLYDVEGEGLIILAINEDINRVRFTIIVIY